MEGIVHRSGNAGLERRGDDVGYDPDDLAELGLVAAHVDGDGAADRIALAEDGRGGLLAQNDDGRGAGRVGPG